MAIMAGVQQKDPNRDSDDEGEKKIVQKEKSRKPPNNAFRQQKLWALAPIFTPKTILPIYYTLGLLSGVFGGLLYWASMQVPSY